MTSPVLEPKLGRLKDRALGFFLPRYRRKFQVSHLPIEMQIVLPHLIISDDAKLAFVKNSKAGCTSVAHIIHQYTKGHGFSGNIHRDGKHLQQGLLYWKDNLRIIKAKEPFLFSFVRHPEKRVISAFLDFFIDKSNPVRNRHSDALTAFGFVEGRSVDQNFDAFLRYIQESFNKDIYHTDRHWRPQYINLGMPVLQYDHIGKLEDFDNELEYIFSEAGIKEFDFNTLKGNVRNRTMPHKLEISATQRAKILELYDKDFEMFGYD